MIQNRCIACHVDGGIGRSTGLVFQRETTASTLNNFNVFDSFLDTRDDALEYILSKASGNSHTGGIQLPKGGTDYNNLQEFLATLTDSAGSNANPSASDDFFSAVTLQSSVATLRRAAIMLAGRLPTDSEIDQVSSGNDAVLRTTLRNLMQGDAFHQFLIDGANDRLLIRGLSDPDLLNGCPACFPSYTNQITDLLLEDFANGNTALRKHFRFLVATQYGLVESPLELIAYVVENDLRYSEILTADYMMLNPTSNFSVEGTAVFENPNDSSEFQPGQMKSYINGPNVKEELFPEVNNARVISVEEPNIDYPHAGVLNTQAFLDRYPTTATNRNRARARWTFLHFLDIDIEKSAQRTTDPVALADTNNPTMNNSNCTVCHATMDPVAGSFQNYSDEGFYRINYEGTDSLDDGYKDPEDGRATPYQVGDTWYRDMRTPGLFSAVAPDSENSLQWLAQQIVQEPGFKTAAVKFWWPSVIGTEVLELPQVEEDSTYAAQLAAYNAQNTSIQELSSGFEQTGLDLKGLLVEMMMSPWFRTETVEDKNLSTTLRAAHQVASLGNETLLTPERLQRKTAAITGFNWRTGYDFYIENETTGFGNEYRLYYGGINSAGVTKRSTEMTPLMSTVAMTHGLESACPIVVREFLLPDEQRKLFSGVDFLLSPLAEGQQEFTAEPTHVDDFYDFSLTMDLLPGKKTINISFLTPYCDWDPADNRCLEFNNIGVDRIEVRSFSGSFSQVFEASSATLTPSLDECGDGGGTDNFYFYSTQCTLTSLVHIPTSDSYTVTAYVSGGSGGVTVPANFLLSIATTEDIHESQARGANEIREKLVELHQKMLGETYSITDPAIVSAYNLFVDSWQERIDSGVTGGMIYNTNGESCHFYNDLNFFENTAYEGEVYSVVTDSTDYQSIQYNFEGTNEFLVNNARIDPVHIKQTWVTLITYLMTHYKYLYE